MKLHQDKKGSFLIALTSIPRCGSKNQAFFMDVKEKVLGIPLDSEEFLRARKRLGKTQKQLAELLGTSLKAVTSYEQGWRTVPAYVERQVFS